MSVVVHYSEELSAADRLAIIDEQLTALAGMPAPDRAGGDHLTCAQQMLTIRRRVEALTAGSLDAMACSGQWSGAAGAKSAAAWLTGSTTEAPEVVKTLLANGAFARRHGLLEEAAAAGEVSQAHVTIWRTVRGKYDRIGMLLDAAEDHILKWARELSPRGFKASLVEFAHRLDPDLVDELEEKKRRRVFLDAVVTLDGYVHVAGLLDPVTGALFLQALEAARRAGTTADTDTETESSTDTESDTDTETQTGSDTDTGGSPVVEDPHADPARAGRSIAERNPEALRRLLDLACAVTGPDGLPSINGTRPRISVHIDASDLVSGDPSSGDPAAPGMGVLHRFGIPGAQITAATTAALACDCSLSPLIVDQTGQIATILPTMRTVPPALRTAILARDHHCRYPGCTGRIDEIHHIMFYSHGGPTTRGNLVGLCYYHHQLVHRHGWQITGNPDGELHFTHPTRYTPDPTAPRTSPAGLAVRKRRRDTHHKARQLLADPHLNPPRRYALLARERNQPPEPPF